MRILVAGTLAGKGGIQTHICWLSKALGEEGVEVLALSLGSSESPPIDENFLDRFWNDNVQLRCCISYRNTSSNRHFSGFHRLREIIEIIDDFNPDIYLAIGTGWNLFIPPLLSKSRPIRIFHEVMSGVPSGWRDSRWCVKFWFDEVIGQATPVSQTFLKEFGWKKNILTLPAFPEPLEITATLPDATAKGVEKSKIKAALFSRLVPHKQAFWLVQQWSKLESYISELHIHGSGPEEDVIRSYIKKEGIGEKVKCWGRYPEGQSYVDLLSNYDLTLLPTIGEEGAPLVLLESMACGVPFLAYGVGGIYDYGRNNPDVMIVSPETDRFLNGLDNLTKSLELKLVNQQRLQQFYIDNYSYKALQKRWLNYFKKILLIRREGVVMPLMLSEG